MPALPSLPMLIAAYTVCGAFFSAQAVQPTLQDSKLYAQFGDDAVNFGQLVALNAIGSPNVIATHDPSPFWSASFVGTGVGAVSIFSNNVTCANTKVELGFPHLRAHTFNWENCVVQAPSSPSSSVNVTLEVSLSNGILEYMINFGGNGTVSLWDYTISLPNVRATSNTKAIETTAATQLTGFYENHSGANDAVYLAAHDPTHIVKTCAGTISKDIGVVGCNVLALDATLPLFNYKAQFPIAMTVLEGDWWDIASIYRRWVLPNSEWTKFGPLDTRTDMPPWMENLTLWMNNNWGGDPLGPNYGGDPMHVQLEMLKVNEVLNLPEHGGHLALHWYEWDTLGYELGSNHTKCDRTYAPCGFDTHYPDYFPARIGCKASVKAMQDAGMRIIPYINGQLFDTFIPRWKDDNASLYVQKFAQQTMKTAAKTPALQPHLENFDDITSAVMCPATKYWHDIMRDTIVQIVNDLGFDGVYVDQVGNGELRNCADPSHNHSINGGSFWAEAFYGIMAEVRSSVQQPSMFMTEGAAEEVSGVGFDILLGMKWWELPFWSAIYGGYGYTTGFAGSIDKPLATGLCAQLTQQFMGGGTMGWFTYQNYGQQFFDPANVQEVSYIQKLSHARIAAKPWMVHGRVTRTLELDDNTSSLYGACFLREKLSESSSLVCAIALPSNQSAATYTLSMEPAKYGLLVQGDSTLVVSNLMTGKRLGTFASLITYSASVASFDVQLLKLSVEKKDVMYF